MLNNRYLRVAWLGFSVCLIFALFSSTVMTLHDKWIQLDEAFSHGYLIVGLVAYLIAGELWKMNFSASLSLQWSMVLLAFIASLLWFFGRTTQTLVFEQIALPFMLYSLLLVCLGVGAAKKLAVLALFLFLALPIWDVFQPQLRYMTAAVVQTLVGWVGIPAYIDGFLIELPYGVLKIAGGCAGLNYLMMGLTLGVLHAYQNQVSAIQGIIQVALIGILSLLGNWIRVFILVLIAHYSNMESSLVKDHLVLGWIIFSVMLVIYFVTMTYLDPLLSRWFPSETNCDEEVVNRERVIEAKGSRVKHFVGFLPVAVVVLFLVITSNSIRPVDFNSSTNENPEISETKSWRSIAVPQLVPKYSGWDFINYWQHKNSDIEVLKYNYLFQAQGKEMIYYENIIADEDHLRHLESFEFQEKSFSVEIVERNKQEYKVAWTHKIGDRYSTSSLGGKISQFTESLRGRQDAALIMIVKKCISSECVSDDDRLDSKVLENSNINEILF